MVIPPRYIVIVYSWTLDIFWSHKRTQFFTLIDKIHLLRISTVHCWKASSQQYLFIIFITALVVWKQLVLMALGYWPRVSFQFYLDIQKVQWHSDPAIIGIDIEFKFSLSHSPDVSKEIYVSKSDFCESKFTESRDREWDLQENFWESRMRMRFWGENWELRTRVQREKLRLRLRMRLSWEWELFRLRVHFVWLTVL